MPCFLLAAITLSWLMNGCTSIWLHTSGSRGHRPGLVQHLGGEIGDADMFGQAVLLGLAQRADRSLEWDVLVVPVDQQQVDIRQLQIFKALVERLLELVGHEMRLAHLGAKEDVLALGAGLPQALTDLFLVAVEPRRIEVRVAHLQRGS